MKEAHPLAAELDAQLGCCWSDEQFAAAVRIIEAHLGQLAAKRAPVSRAERNSLFDALCGACHIPTGGMTTPMKRTIAVALAAIQAVMPALSVEEILLRARQYRRLHPSWDLQPMALAKHWGSLATIESVQGLLDEPASWRPMAVQIFGPEIEPASAQYLAAQRWENLARSQQARVCRVMAEGSGNVVEFQAG